MEELSQVGRVDRQERSGYRRPVVDVDCGDAR